MNVGTINQTPNGLIGQITTYQQRFNFRLAQNQFRNGDNAPDYLVVAKSPAGHEVQIGSVWKKTKQTVGGIGEEFFSISIDSPDFQQPLHVAAFKDRSIQNQWNVVWTRPRQKTASSTPDNAVA